MRCPDCAKFTSLEPGGVEVNVEVEPADDGAQVTGNVRIVLQCADCSSELKEATFDVDVEVPLHHLVAVQSSGPDEERQGHASTCSEPELEVEFTPDADDKFEPPKAKRQTHYYGAVGTVDVSCVCGAKGAVDWEDWVKSSAMDELV
jgi:hypothetical protein